MRIIMGEDDHHHHQTGSPVGVWLGEPSWRKHGQAESSLGREIGRGTARSCILVAVQCSRATEAGESTR